MSVVFLLFGAGFQNISHKTNIYNAAFTNNKKANETKIAIFMKISDLDIRRGAFKALRVVSRYHLFHPFG